MLADGQIIDTVTPRHANMKVNSKLTKAEPVWNPSMGKSWRVLWWYSTKRVKRDAITLEAQRRRALDAIDGVKPARKPRFIKTTRSGCSFDSKAFERAQRLEGLKGYVTNLPATLMPAGEVIASYHDVACRAILDAYPKPIYVPARYSTGNATLSTRI
ncbi:MULTISPECIES: hypothetical protein [Mobiluncus]|uniref:hypothetical protein n=1 Tax=Mobiluncus TaxID=2050 RepID=UPI0001E0A537|nr:MULTISPECIES: hypothetical protein [Mobiluncus]EFL93494.1 hypothetical protein HMPREF0574_1224 [Mobiluncus curtisii subsp. curtisii ATCC 35241]STY76242.1 Uncharacterised protein [Mobiluncus curtisii subsp. curtisii]STY89582.1 Uncharacterised protein [Mobiluncus holmesii]